MNKIITKSITLFMLMCCTLSMTAYNVDENFCLNGDVPEAQMNFKMMCLTAPVIFCPPTYFGCPNDNLDPSLTGTPTVMPGDANCPTPIVSYTDVISSQTSCLTIIHRTWEATYPSGSASIKLHSSCQQTLYLEDNEAPVISNCPSDLTVDLSVACDSTASWSLPVASENCELLYFITTNFSGTTFSSGTTQVTYTALDRCGLMSQCSFNVTVVGSCCNAPSITCPASASACPVNGITDPSATGQATATPTDPSCGTPIITYQDITTSTGPCNGEMIIQRTWTANDASDSSQSSSCTQTIEVSDNTPPVLSNIPNDITVSGNGSGCDVQVFWSEPTSADNCGVANMTSNFDSGSFFQSGTTTIVYTVADNCGLTATASFLVTVNCLCNAQPVITCPADYTGCPTGNYPEPTVTGTATAVAGDNTCGAPVVTYTDQVISSGPCASEYEIIRTWIATDPNNSALTATCTQSISLQDDGAPTITNVPTDITLFKKGSHCFMPVTWTAPTYSDDCSLSSSGSNIANGSDFAGGTTTVIFTAVDVCGNVATASFNITIECNTCNTPPAITCPINYASCPGGFIPSPAIAGQPTITNQGGTCGPAIVYHSDSFTSFGNCPGSFNVQRTWTAFDQYNPALSTTCIQQITIDDNIAPVISGTPSSITQNSTGANCQLSINWVPPTVADECGVSSFVSSHNPGDIFSEGTTTVTYTATDNCGNITTSSFAVIIVCQACTTAPNITCPPTYTACPSTSTNPAVTGFAAGSNTAQDCGAPLITYNDLNINAPACNGAVSLERTWTATESSNPNLTATCIQYIYLSDSTVPTFTFVPNNISVTGTGNNCQAPATWTTPTATDNCGSVTLTSNFNSGHTFSQGNTTVTYTATDACGNITTASFVVTVGCAACTTLPTITCPSNYTACPGTSSNPSVTGSATGSITGPNCSGTPIITYTDINPTSTSCPNAQYIQRTWTATNPSDGSLTASCIQNIQLADTTPPVISNVPANITINGTGTGCQVIANWAIPTATDNCNLTFFEGTHQSGATFSEGTTTVTYTANDGCGNTVDATFTITVLCAAICNSNPIITCPADYFSCPTSGIPSPAVCGTATAIAGGTGCAAPIVTYTDLITSSGPCPTSKVVQRTWTATDPSNASLTASCTQNIFLQDNTAPTFVSAPNNITITGTGAGCQMVGTWVLPVATDNCGSVTLSSTHNSGSLYPEGVTTVTYTATDACGNTSNISFTVTVICNSACTTPPTISCPANYTSCPTAGVPGLAVSGSATATASSSGCNTPTVTYNDVIVSNGPCAGAKVVQRTFTATDPNNGSLATSCTQTITLEDNQAPLFVSCPADIVLMGTPNTGSGSGCFAIANWAIPTVTDNCGTPTISAMTQSGQSVGSGSTFYQGTTVVTYTATDACGNASTCEFDVTVDCNGNGNGNNNVLTCPSDIVVSCGTNGGQHVSWSPPTFSGSCGSCDGGNIPGFMYMGSFGGSEYYCSLQSATWQNANQLCESSGGFLACIGSAEENEFLANLLTLQSAWIGLSDGDQDGQFTWSCGEPVSYTNWYPGQPNNYNGNQACVEMLNNGQWNDQYPYYLLEFIMEKPCSFVNQIAGPTSGTFLTAGDYTATYETSDVCGPIQTCSFDITVENGLSMTCPDNIVTSAAANSQGVAVNWNLPEISSCCSDCSSGGGFIPGFVYMGTHNGHHYYCSTGAANWPTAQANCVANGGNLAVINTASENAFLANILMLQSAWIGSSDVASEGTFTWVNGEPFSYTNWYPGQPNNYNNNQHYVEMLNNGQWNDQYGSYALEYIMEISNCMSLTQTAGPTSGSVLPPGSNHTVTYDATDGCGNVETCSFTIEVESVATVCNPGGDNSNCHYIQQCIFGSINNISGNNGGYADFSNFCTITQSGEALSLKLVPGFGGCSAEKVYWTIWIDYNLDGDYYDSNEFVAYGCGINTMNGIVTMPHNLTSGITSMRVIMKQGGYADDPCQQYPKGETEDYCIKIDFDGGNVASSTVHTETENRSRDIADAVILMEDKVAGDQDIHTVSVYPNPVSIMMSIEVSDVESVERMQLHTADGKLAIDMSDVVASEIMQVDVSTLQTGVYMLQTLYNDGQVITKRIIIQK